jgi:hypothetical protein
MCLFFYVCASLAAVMSLSHNLQVSDLGIWNQPYVELHTENPSVHVCTDRYYVFDKFYT